MSFILDALRKVDQESRQVGEVVPPVVAIEKLRQERVRRRRSQFAVMAAIALASAAATALLLRTPSAPVPQASAVEDAKPPVPEVEPPRTEAKAVSPERAPEPPAPTAQREAPPKIETPAPIPRAAEPPPELPRLVLQGTSVLDGKPVAVVSDRRVFEGDTIEGAVVIRIEERAVELEFKGRRFTLTL